MSLALIVLPGVFSIGLIVLMGVRDQKLDTAVFTAIVALGLVWYLGFAIYDAIKGKKIVRSKSQ